MEQNTIQNNTDFSIETLNPKPTKKRKGVIIFSVLGVIVIAAFLVLVVVFLKPGNNNQIAFSPTQKTSSPTPTPMPFEELTIPALRAREYKSEMGELEQVSINSAYTSYSTYYTSDGYRVNAQLTIPRDDDTPIEGWSAIVFIHGYIPPDSYQTFQNYASYVDYLARNGFVVFKIDLRGHGESDGEPGGGYYGADYVIDALNARAALQTTDFVSPGKIGLWGHSMAGNIVLRSLAVAPEIPAGVTWGGAVFTYEDWQKYGIDDGSYRPPAAAPTSQSRRQQLMDTHGQFDKTHPFWSKFAPTAYLSEIKGAIQLNHAVDDPVVNIGYSRDLNQLLNSTEVEHELKEYPSGGHNFTGATFSQAMQNTVTFFKENL